ncbi:MAG TPA: HlyD family efflux transporter periplasmic adaptor subunit [Terracidiphilus sp.]|jgi:multidrug resistance efflux pump|nr:HlyD family efflux transporter periplasmic adaptor subunit [Terracidiphilus sp.]
MAVLLFAATAFFAACHRTSKGKATATAQSASASMASLRLAGKTEAILSRSIQAPILTGQQMNSLTVTYLAPAGARVKRGDMLVEFDQQAQLRDFMDKKADADDKESKVQQEQAKEDAAKAKDETEIEQAQTSLQKAELEMQKKELLSRIDAEKAQETLDEARATLAQLKQTFALKRKSAQASIRILEIQRDRTREAMLHAKANAALMQIRSPIDGVVVLKTIWKNGNFGEVQVGDQIRGGNAFMEVVDPSAMEVHVKVNQEDMSWLKVGEQVVVYLDAYPQLKFRGQLESVDPMGQNGDFSSLVRTFSATFSIQGTDPRLMPDLSAAVDLKRLAATQPGSAKE